MIKHVEDKLQDKMPRKHLPQLRRISAKLIDETDMCKDAFGDDGKLGEGCLEKLLIDNSKRTELLSKYVIDGVLVKSSKLVPGMMPFSHGGDQHMSSTTCVSILALKDMRHTALLFTYTQSMLMDVVDEMRLNPENMGQNEKNWLMVSVLEMIQL